MRKDDFYRSYGRKLNREDVSEEDKFFLPAYDMFQNMLDNVHKNYDGLNIDFALINNLSFNAHALKIDDKEYLIAIRSGVIHMTFTVIGEMCDLFKQRYQHFEDKETPVGLGCTFIWSQIFAHEFGHIIRGHTDIRRSNLISLIEEGADFESLIEIPEIFREDKSELQFLIELDADHFSGAIVAEILLNTIRNSKRDDIMSEKELIDLCFCSLLIFFNFVCEKEGCSGRYPPAMLRAEAIISQVIRSIAEKVSLTKDELTDLMGITIKETIAFLIDVDYLNQGLNREELDYLYQEGLKASAKYPEFSVFISKNNLLKTL